MSMLSPLWSLQIVILDKITFLELGVSYADHGTLQDSEEAVQPDLTRFWRCDRSLLDPSNND